MSDTEFDVHEIPGDGDPKKPVMMMDANEFSALGDEDVINLRDHVKGAIEKVSQEGEMSGFASTSQKNMYKYLLNEDHRSFDMSRHEPFRVGSLVRARQGTDLYRYLSDYHKTPNTPLKIEEVNVFNEGAHDYLVSSTSDSTSWLVSQPLPVAHADLEAVGSMLTGVSGSVSREGTGGPLQEDA